MKSIDRGYCRRCGGSWLLSRGVGGRGYCLEVWVFYDSFTLTCFFHTFITYSFLRHLQTLGTLQT
uniref:Uncharacterized protein n=1 Tax=Oncorhynchus tshawytscha TaxID=74940 RepID=A0AAZ3QRM7_ONCTS